MKVRFIFSFLTALLIAGSTLANVAQSAASEDRFDGLDIVLKGEVGTDTSRSIPIIPIKAVLGDDGFVHILFIAPIGTVQIFANGELQETSEVTTLNQEASFSVVGWAPGVYKLELKTPKGGYVYGEFVVE